MKIFGWKSKREKHLREGLHRTLTPSRFRGRICHMNDKTKVWAVQCADGYIDHDRFDSEAIAQEEAEVLDTSLFGRRAFCAPHAAVQV